MKMNFLVGAIIAMAVCAATFAAPPPAAFNRVPDELIVKFRPAIADKISAQAEFTPQRMMLTPRLDKLHRSNKVKELRPLFSDFKKSRQTMDRLRHKDKSLLNSREKRILMRLGRADMHAHVPDLSGIYRLKVEPGAGRTLEDVLEVYRSDPNVEYAEFNYMVSADKIPNDPHYDIQWSLNNTGQDYPYSGRFNIPPGSPDDDIDAPEAWDDATGTSETVVAVVDTGVDYNHRDLRNNIWVNTAELGGVPGNDDDNNGYVDDVYGYDFINSDADPLDDAGHGTHCAGTIAAEGNNGLDVAGVCWNAQIMALKFLGASGSGDIADALTAFHYAVENGADVISNSWGGGGFSQATQDVINYAHSQGVLMVASAGNDGLNYPQYPAYYDNMFSVAATNSLDTMAPFSNYGSWVDIAAPGVDVLSLLAGGTYIGTPYDDYTTVLSGTSMSCPHVSGACALLLSIDPLMASSRLEQCLKDSADPIDPNICASGRLNLFHAVRQVIGPDGRILLDREAYQCQGDVGIELRDSHLTDTTEQMVTIVADGGDSETIALAQRTAGLGVFNGAISLEVADPVIGDSILQAAAGQTITVMYDDANDGTGSPAKVFDTAIIDCQPPRISKVRIGYPGSAPAISFTTSEPTTARVRCALSCGGQYVIINSDNKISTTHTIILAGVTPGTDYYFVVDANDIAGNNTSDTNKSKCYQFTTTAPGTIYVPQDFSTIQDAIDNSWDDGVVCVADGIYTGPGNSDLDLEGKSITVRSLAGPENCVIDCNGSPDDGHRAFILHSGEDANSVIQGFTIRNGHVPGSWYVGVGGAILTTNGSSPTITDCVFINNTAGWDGGAICNLNGHLNIDNCVFISNRAIGNDGGAINNETGSVTVTSSQFTGNRAFDWGGAIRNIVSAGNTVDNSIFSGNVADDGGALLFYYDSTGTIDNCTFAGNHAANGNAVGSAEAGPANKIEVNSSIFAGDGNQVFDSEVSQFEITYTNIPGPWPGNGNIDADPCFAAAGFWDANNWIDGDYHLKSQTGRWDSRKETWVQDSRTSLCIDAGDPVSDWSQEPWPNGGRVNMGAFGNTPYASKSILDPPAVQAELRFAPQALNLTSQGTWLKALMMLPAGLTIDDVDKNLPATIEPLGIQSSSIKSYLNEDGRVTVDILFDRRSVAAALNSASTALTVRAFLRDGRYVYGIASLNVTGHDLEGLSILASQWLLTGSNLEADLDKDNRVNLSDYTIFMGAY